MKQQPPPPPSFQAFTVKANGGRLDKIVTVVGVSKPSLNGEPPGAKDIRQTTAIWDTGATQSVVTKATARALDLVPSGMARVFHAGGESDFNAYLVNLHLPNGLNVAAVHVLEMEDGQDFGVLIGMDVITLGDFTITNVGGVTSGRNKANKHKRARSSRPLLSLFGCGAGKSARLEDRRADRVSATAGLALCT